MSSHSNNRSTESKCLVRTLERIVNLVVVAHAASTDPLSEALLASATAPSATSKHKTLELYNPSNVVELKYTGALSFRWSFKWETCVVLFLPTYPYRTMTPTRSTPDMNSNGNAKNAS